MSVEWRAVRVGAVAGIVYGIGSLGAMAAMGLIVHLRVVTPAELLADVAANRPAWIGAQGVLIGSQALLVPFILGLALTLGHRARLAWSSAAGLFGIAALLLIMSGVFHGVLGVHLASPTTARGVPSESLLRDVELVHALGDTTYFVSVVAVCLAFLVLSPAFRVVPAYPRWLGPLGVATALIGIVEFLWFVVPAAGNAAPVFSVLQATWFTVAGGRMWSVGPSVQPAPKLIPAAP